MADEFGQWGTVQFDIPDFLEDIRDSVNDFAELLVVGLEIANLALDFAKAFATSHIDPVTAIIEAIVAEIRALVDDLRQLGLYITGDWALLGWPPEDLRGGFQAYERRMLARLTDRTDPTRPEVSSKTKVLGLFGYKSVDPSDFEQLVNFILNLIKMFGLSYFPDTSRLPVPQIQAVQYGPDTVNVFNFGPLINTLTQLDGTAPKKARVTWVTQSASQKHPANPFSVLGPSGYLVTVSTIPDGIHLRYARPRANTDKVDVGGHQVQPREYGNVLDKDGQPIVLHGGAEMLAIRGSDFEYNAGIDLGTGVPRDGVCQVFGVLDPASNEVIPLEDLGEATALGNPGDGRGSEFLLQRTFLIETRETLAQWFAGEYSAVLALADMPQKARWEKANGRLAVLKDGPAAHYYVRVWSVGARIADHLIADRVRVPQWDLAADTFKTNVWKSGEPFVIDMKSGGASVSRPSAARKITFPNAHTAEYLHAIKTALLLLVTSRSDLPLLADLATTKTQEIIDQYAAGDWVGQGIARTATGLESARHLIGLVVGNIKRLAEPDQNPVQWRGEIYRQIHQVALNIYERTGPLPDAEEAVVQATAELRTLRWSDILDQVEVPYQASWLAALKALGVAEEPTLIEAINPDNPVSQLADHGLCPNVLATGIGSGDADELFLAERRLQDEGTLRTLFPGRGDEYLLWDGGDLELVTSVTDKAEVADLLDRVPEGLHRIYEKFIQEDGSLLVPNLYVAMLNAVTQSRRSIGSGDFTPVFLVGRDILIKVDKDTSEMPVGAGIIYARHAYRRALKDVPQGENVDLAYQQAALALQVGTAAFTRSPDDGEWIALRIFDALPELEAFFASIEDWTESLASALQSRGDALERYLEFLQSQIVELQQLIRRVDAHIQSLLGFSLAIPQFSGLMLVSNGTDGLVSDLVSATNKPSDVPTSYGGGVAIVAPVTASFLLDLVSVVDAEVDPTALTAVSRPPAAVGIEAVEPAAGPAPTNEPDVL